ncbi:hypothetical protein HDU78_005825 [Chytriomyces hyalinus]|nr:hypothetical protein HDU78_005825 [Chytriomyces hyalinus]
MTDTLPAIQQPARQKRAAAKSPPNPTTEEIADHVSRTQIPYIHAYQFHGYDPSRDPLLIRKQPILRPLVDFQGLEFHRHWPLEYLSQRLQKERDKELSHFKKLFQLRVNNPYTATNELEYYKNEAAKKKTRQHKNEPPLPTDIDDHETSDHTNNPEDTEHHPTHPPKARYIPPELRNGPHVLQQKLRTRYQKYRHLIHPPQHPFPTFSADIVTNAPHTPRSQQVYDRLATKQPCKHITQELESAAPPLQNLHNHPPPSTAYFTQLALPKTRRPEEPHQAMVSPLHHGPPPSKERLEALSKPRVVYPVHEYAEAGIPKEMSLWKPKTHQIVLSPTQKARLNEISLPRNWKEIREMRMHDGYGYTPKGAHAEHSTAQGKIADTNAVANDAAANDAAANDATAIEVVDIKTEDEVDAVDGGAVSDAVADETGGEQPEEAHPVHDESQTSTEDEHKSSEPATFEDTENPNDHSETLIPSETAVSPSHMAESEVETPLTVPVAPKSISPHSQSMTNIAEKIAQSLHSLRSSIRRASTIKSIHSSGSAAALVASSKTVSKTILHDDPNVEGEEKMDDAPSDVCAVDTTETNPHMSEVAAVSATEEGSEAETKPKDPEPDVTSDGLENGDGSLKSADVTKEQTEAENESEPTELAAEGLPSEDNRDQQDGVATSNDDNTLEDRIHDNQMAEPQVDEANESPAHEESPGEGESAHASDVPAEPETGANAEGEEAPPHLEDESTANVEVSLGEDNIADEAPAPEDS